MELSPYSTTISTEQLENLARECHDWAMCHGVVMRSTTPACDLSLANASPLTLLPTVFPRSAFDDAQRVQEDYNLLYHRVAHDYDFLKTCLARSVQADNFLSHLWDIYEHVRLEGTAQPLTLCLARSDYMLDGSCDTPQIKQVEMNTIAAGMAALSVGVSRLHSYMLGLLGISGDKHIEPNTALVTVATGLVKAWEAYGNNSAAILFLVEKPEVNFSDQRHIQYAVRAINPSITVIRATLRDVMEALPLGGDDGRRLLVFGLEIAVIYMRYCYSPSHFPTEKEWAARLEIERSRAIKSPSIHLHLAGSKKVQQELARPGCLERFLRDDPDACTRLRATFTGLYSLDAEEGGNEVMALALKKPQNYVLKPQREGGGNNLYGDEIAHKWAAICGTEEQSAFILMDRIVPRSTLNYRLLPGKGERGLSLSPTRMVSELGVFGSLLGSAETVLWNAGGGYLLRTKPDDMNEGGVSAGFSVMDTPCLV